MLTPQNTYIALLVVRLPSASVGISCGTYVRLKFFPRRYDTS